MPATQAFHVLFTLLVSLFPLALYCMALSGVNRRERPALVRGSWDFVGVMCAASGMLLWTVPTLMTQLYRGAITTNPGLDEPQSFEVLLGHWWIVWACYYGLLIAGAVLLLLLRSTVTAIYNVDAEQVPRRLLDALRNLGYDFAQNDQNQTMIAPAKSLTPGSGVAPAFTAAVEIEPFPGMAHATLHWYTGEKRLRDQVERELAKQLAQARPADNPASVWFLGASTLLFGGIFLAVAFYVISGFFPRRW